MKRVTMNMNNPQTVLRFAHCCKKQRSGLDSRSTSRHDAAATARTAAFSFVPTFSAARQERPRARRFSLRGVPGKSNPVVSPLLIGLGEGGKLILHPPEAIMATIAGAFVPNSPLPMVTAAHQQGASHE